MSGTSAGCRGGHVLAEELAELEEEHGEARLGPLVGGVLHALADLATGRQFSGRVVDGGVARRREAVVVLGGQDAPVGPEGRAPQRVPQVVARAVERAVALLVLVAAAVQLGRRPVRPVVRSALRPVALQKVDGPRRQALQFGHAVAAQALERLFGQDGAFDHVLGFDRLRRRLLVVEGRRALQRRLERLVERLLQSRPLLEGRSSLLQAPLEQLAIDMQRNAIDIRTERPVLVTGGAIDRCARRFTTCKMKNQQRRQQKNAQCD